MKVLYIDAVGPFGGSSRSLFEAVKVLAAGPVKAYFVMQRGTSEEFYRKLAQDVIAVRGLTRFDNTRVSHYHGMRWLVPLREVFHFPYTLLAVWQAKRRWGEVDLIHVNEVIDIIPGLVAKALFKAPMVVHVRSLQWTNMRALRTRWVNARLRKSAAAVVAINENTRASLPDELHVDVIQNSFTPKKATNPDPALVARLSTLRPTSLKVGFVGNLHAAKGLFELLEAIRILRGQGLDVECLVVGSVTIPDRGLKAWLLARAGLAQNVEADVHARVREYGIADSFHLVGHTNDIQTVYEQLDVIAFPSYFDAPGRPVFEAAFSGVPSIVCVERPRPDTLVPGETGLTVPPMDAPALADAIRYFALNRHEVRRMGGNARALAVENFVPATNAQKLLTVYERVLAASGRARVRQPDTRTTREPHMSANARRPYAICSNCIMDTSDSNITFDARGWCDYCNNYHVNILPHWHPDEQGERELAPVIERIKRDGRGKDHDCLIGISGGVDSSYLTYLAKVKFGLRPLLFHVDAGWNSQQAVNNIEKLVDGLGVDLHTEVVDWQEMKDLQLAFFKSGVAHLDTPQDHAFFAGLYNFAANNGFKYILTGANYSTECVREPLEWHYHASDLRQIMDIHRQFGTRPMKTFPMADIAKFKIYYRFVKGIRVVKPLNHVHYIKEDAMNELVEKYGWQKYAHKHYESRFTRFYEGYWLPKKFGYDKRRAHFSSLILTGQFSREQALEKIAQPAYDPETVAQDFEYIATKLGLSVPDLQALMDAPNRSYRDYKNAMGFIELGTKVLRALGIQRAIIR